MLDEHKNAVGQVKLTETASANIDNEGLKMKPRRLCHANVVRNSGLAVRAEGDRCSHREGD
jgi:hypothetical protein